MANLYPIVFPSRKVSTSPAKKIAYSRFSIFFAYLVGQNIVLDYRILSLFQKALIRNVTVKSRY